MTEIFRLAISCMLDQFGRVDFSEVERLLFRACGYRWVATPDWRFEEPPHPGVPCVPVIVLRHERDALLSPVDGRSSAVLSEVVLGEAEVRQWRHACFQRCPFPQPNGDHFPWEVVRFDLADGGAIFHKAVASFMDEVWAIDGDALFVSPRDAALILQMQSPTNFQYQGRAVRRGGGVRSL